MILKKCLGKVGEALGRFGTPTEEGGFDRMDRINKKGFFILAFQRLLKVTKGFRRLGMAESRMGKPDAGREASADWGLRSRRS